MLHQRKRFNYLSNQQRALNTSNFVQTEKITQTSKRVQTYGSETKQEKEYSALGQQYGVRSRNSSIKKNIEPLSEILCNIQPIQSEKKVQTSRYMQSSRRLNSNLQISNKQNKPVIMPITKQQKHLPTFISQSQNQKSLQSRILELQTQNKTLIQQTEQKFVLMQKHLEKVEVILKEKESSIELLSEENTRLKGQNQKILSENRKFSEEKEDLLRLIGEKNREMKDLRLERDALMSKQTQLLQKITQLNSSLEKQEIQQKSIEIIEIPKFLQENYTQTDIIQTKKSQIPVIKPDVTEISLQTDLRSIQIDQLTAKVTQKDEKQCVNYRQKYESLFKKALQMQDQIYKLKQELFDSQSEVKTLQQQFNTYKIFNQIQKINQKI